MREARDLHISGIVQGVGFRPFVYRAAKKYGIAGWVRNAVDGVFVHAEADSDVLDAFVMYVHDNPPAAAHIQQIQIEYVPLQACEGFEIVFSDDAAAQETTLVSADLAMCPECESELYDASNRRYRYPFINCTNCGPRFTIIEKLPYDRPFTSMQPFAMCPDCAAEYENPEDRRFHAQPDACWECGPNVSYTPIEQGVSLQTRWGKTREESDAIFAQAVQDLLEGKILAVKGLGGFHLVCDAENEQAVALLRKRKRREGKPFAVMAQDAQQARAYCQISEEEEALLSGMQRPIVLLRKRDDASFVPGLADDLQELGVMLPYTPVQNLLMHDFAQRGGHLLVMTSGNVHDEPIVTDDALARSCLAEIADAIMGNNREILTRYDDSVVRVLDFGALGTALQFVRRARGYAPTPLHLANGLGAPDGSLVLATGPEQKNTACFMRDNDAFVTQHVGDMENAPVNDAWFEVVERYQQLFDMHPTMLSCDMHPEYLTTKWARESKEPRVEVQHHHAHVASALAESAMTGPALGFAFDGTGYGVDGSIWGGEALLFNLTDFERFGNFACIPLPGGAAAVKHPLRTAYGALWAFDLLEHPATAEIVQQLGSLAQVMDQMIDNGINTPHTSSVGRLFDAASALLGLCTEPRYEGEGAVLLEAAAHRAERRGKPIAFDSRYTIVIQKNTATDTSTAQDTSVLMFDAAPTFQALLDDKHAGVCADEIALRFHYAFVELIVSAAQVFRALYDISVVVLSGGVFLNRLLVESAVPLLAEAGFTVVLNREVPPNDGCISLGQAVIACAQQRQS